jgi:large conductance mechanosensitive channel
MSMLQEFKEFAMKGNVVDLAVGVIIGGAFGKIVSSLVADVIMPPIGILMGGVDFTKLGVVLKDAVDEKTPAVMLNYGNFVQTIVDFTIVAFAIFMAIKLMNKLKKAEVAAPEAPPAPTKEELLLTEIRDILKSKN